MLDMKTAIVIYAAICIGCAMALAMVWYQGRKHFKGLALGLAYMSMEAAGAILMILRGNIPDFYSIVVANILIMGGMWVLLLGLERFSGLKSSLVFNCILLIIFSFLHFYFGVIQPDLAHRNINTNLAGLIYSAQSIWLILYRVRPEMRRIMSGLAVAISVLALVLVARMVVQFVFPLQSNSFFESGNYDVIMIILMVMAIVGITFNLVAMVNRRLLGEVQLYLIEKDDAVRSLQESENKYRQLVESSLTGIYILQDGKYVYANGRFAQMHGYTVSELTGMEYWQLDHPAERDMATHMIKDRIDGKIVLPVQRRRIRKDGTEFRAEMMGTAIDYHGRQAILGNVIDITERRKMEEALLESQDRYRAIVENTDAGIILQEASGKILTWNKAAERVFGLSEKEAMEHTSVSRDWGCIHADGSDFPGTDHPSMRTLATGEPCRNVVMGIKNHDHEIKWIEINTSPLFREGIAKPYAVVIAFSDITQRKEADDQLSRQNALLSAINSIFSKALTRETEEEFLKTCLSICESITGSEFGWIGELNNNGRLDTIAITNPGWDACKIPKSESPRLIKDMKIRGIWSNVIKSGTSVIASNPSSHPDSIGIPAGHPPLNSFLGIPLKSGDKTIGAISLANKKTGYTDADVSDIELLSVAIMHALERRRGEQALETSEKLYRSLFYNTINGLAYCKMLFEHGQPVDFIYISINAAFEKLTGLKNVEGKKVSEVIPGIQQSDPGLFELYGRVALTGIPEKCEYYLNALGMWFSLSIYSPGKEHFVAVFDVITEKKQAEESLRLQAEMLDRAADWVEVHDIDGKLIYVNQAICDAHGYTREEMLSMNLNQLDSTESLLQLEQRRKQMRERSQITFLTNHVRKDGSLIPVEVTATLTKWHDRAVVMSIARDITERKHLDEERQRAAKLQSVGVLAGGIAHDFNNILTAILGNISIAAMDTKPGEDIHTRLIEAEKASLRAKDLTQQLLTFARGGAPVKKQAHLGQMIKETAGFALRGSNSSCQFTIPPDLWPAEVDQGQISQVVNNLVINARQAMPMGGSIEIRAENFTLTEKLRLGRSLPLEPGNYVRISVADHGTGISPQYLDKIFDPYFTTKQTGSGLGLATSYSIIRNHGGHISVESEVNKGSTFYIYIPASAGKTECAATETAEELPAGSGRILVMDDEATIREVAQRMLYRLGYEEVTLAAHGEEAITLYQEAMKAGKPFAAVILDLTIPGGMGGKETIIRLREIDPRVKAIVSSGYANEAVMSEFQKYGFKGIVTKPYTVEHLGKTVSDVISGSSK